MLVDYYEAVPHTWRESARATTSSRHPPDPVAVARNERPDLILCDVNMPGMDGGDVSKALYADAEARDIPVLFLSALVTPGDMKNLGHQIGGRSAISKQTPQEELAKRIETLIRV